jgi:hypothetical protein
MGVLMAHARNIILHYHIFKNAGSTFSAALERNFGHGFAQLHAPHHDERISGDALLDFVHVRPDIVAISSHHLSPPAPATHSVQFHEVLILRDPLDRIRSMYDFYRRAAITDDPLTLEAKCVALPEFLEYLIETRQNLVTNAQTNVVANAGAKIPGNRDLNRALAVLRATAVVGVVENFDFCVLEAEHSLRPLFPALDLSYVRENVTPFRAKDLQSRLDRFRQACGEKLYIKLVELNRFDMELVAAAGAESLRRWRDINRQQMQLRNFRRRVHQRRIVCTVANQFLRLRRLCGRAARLLSQQD